MLTEAKQCVTGGRACMLIILCVLYCKPLSLLSVDLIYSGKLLPLLVYFYFGSAFSFIHKLVLIHLDYKTSTI